MTTSSTPTTATAVPVEVAAPGIKDAQAGRGHVLVLRMRGAFRGVDNVLAVVGSVLFPLGFVVILLGWYGASRTPNLFEQIPYAISGGVIGLAMVIGAGLLYFASWVAAAAREQRAASAELLAVMHDIRRELQSRPVDVPREVPVQPGRARKATANGGVRSGSPSVELVATAAGSMLHRPDCTVVAERSDLRTVDPATSGLRPCRLCDPLRSVDTRGRT